MWCLEFTLIHLISCGEDGRWLSCHDHREWRGVVKLGLRNIAHDVVHFGCWNIELGLKQGKYGMKLSEDREPLFLVLMKWLIKQVGFIVIGSASAEVFTGKKLIARARDADQTVSAVACCRQEEFFSLLDRSGIESHNGFSGKIREKIRLLYSQLTEIASAEHDCRSVVYAYFDKILQLDDSQASKPDKPDKILVH